MVGKVLIERIARIPVEVDIASEFRYRDPMVDENTVVLAISQSGETADTLAAMEEGRSKGAMLWSIVNAIGSQAMRMADGYISMQTGPEIGVASTKAYTAPLVDLYMLAILLADLRGTLEATPARQADRGPAPGARPGRALPGPRGRGRAGGARPDAHQRTACTWGAASTCPPPTKAP